MGVYGERLSGFPDDLHPNTAASIIEPSTESRLTTWMYWNESQILLLHRFFKTVQVQLSKSHFIRQLWMRLLPSVMSETFVSVEMKELHIVDECACTWCVKNS